MWAGMDQKWANRVAWLAACVKSKNWNAKSGLSANDPICCCQLVSICTQPLQDFTYDVWRWGRNLSQCTGFWTRYQRAVYIGSSTSLPCSPAEHIPTDQHHIKVDRKPQSAGKVNCHCIVDENTILNFPPEEKSSLKTPDDPRRQKLSRNQT